MFVVETSLKMQWKICWHAPDVGFHITVAFDSYVPAAGPVVHSQLANLTRIVNKMSRFIMKRKENQAQWKNSTHSPVLCLSVPQQTVLRLNIPLKANQYIETLWNVSDIANAIACAHMRGRIRQLRRKWIIFGLLVLITITKLHLFSLESVTTLY
jgi:hypothetical protein